jgi:hypothetical protein
MPILIEFGPTKALVGRFLSTFILHAQKGVAKRLIIILKFRQLQPL